MHKLLILSFSILAIFTNCTNLKQNVKIQTDQKNQTESLKPTIVFVHGTLFPLVNFAVRAFDCPVGFTPISNLSSTSLHKTGLKAMLNADRDKFAIDKCYIFGWDGKLGFRARKKASLSLYNTLRKINGPIILIGHSHGGNVALNLAQIAKEKKDKSLKIEKLILLATPVLAITQNYVKSPIFKNIVSFYSFGDKIQVLDPQALYKESKEFKKEKNKKVAFFTKRLFPTNKNLIQVRILDKNKDILHAQFIFKSFLKSLPATLDLIDQKYLQKDNSYRIRKCTINI